MVTTLDESVLIEAALVARSRAYAPYSKFAVGAAVLTESGVIFHGCNIENAAYGVGCCAERTALFCSYAAGERQIVAIAVVADTTGPVSPCGACRQVISELAPRARVLLSNLHGNLQVTTPQELLPGAFGPHDLE